MLISVIACCPVARREASDKQLSSCVRSCAEKRFGIPGGVGAPKRTTSLPSFPGGFADICITVGFIRDQGHSSVSSPPRPCSRFLCIFSCPMSLSHRDGLAVGEPGAVQDPLHEGGLGQHPDRSEEHDGHLKKKSTKRAGRRNVRPGNGAKSKPRDRPRAKEWSLIAVSHQARVRSQPPTRLIAATDLLEEGFSKRGSGAMACQ